MVVSGEFKGAAGKLLKRISAEEKVHRTPTHIIIIIIITTTSPPTTTILLLPSSQAVVQLDEDLNVATLAYEDVCEYRASSEDRQGARNPSNYA